MNVKTRKILIGSVVAIAVGLFILISNPSIMWHFNSPFKTQTIIYRNIVNTNITIEFQMQDSGALGYNRRVVKVDRSKMFIEIQSVDTAEINKSEWTLENTNINELGLKGG